MNISARSHSCWAHFFKFSSDGAIHHVSLLLGCPSGQILNGYHWSRARRGPKDHQHCSCLGFPGKPVPYQIKTITMFSGTYQSKKLCRVNEPVARKSQKVAINFHYSHPHCSHFAVTHSLLLFFHRTTRRRQHFTVPPSMDTLMWFLCCSMSWPTPPWETAGRRHLWTWPRCMDGWRSVQKSA